MADDLLSRIREAIRGESLDGWLFYNFRHRDKLADDILGIADGASNTRPWAYIVPLSGTPLKIVHAIERTILDPLPGAAVVYVSREAFENEFKRFAGHRLAAHVSDELPILSFLDAGTASLFERAGIGLCSAAAPIQRLKGLLNPEGIASHERAAAALYDIVSETWALIDAAFRKGAAVGEGAVREAILRGMEARGISTDHPPIVAAGSHAGDPHYDFSGEGARFQSGDVIQLDLWAKEQTRGAIYADISWVGVFGEQADEDVERAWVALTAARDEAVRFIDSSLQSGIVPTGAEADERVRAALIAAGFQAAIRHRTGHGIDTECHGSGANLDSIEFPDRRLLLEGSCFSVEPGLYFERFGLRTEIDVYIQGGRARVSGKERQREILRCGRSIF